MTEELIKISYAENLFLALWKLNNNSSSTQKNIFLTHGTFSNRKVLMGISSYLVENGFTCWILEWRNHGASAETDQNFNFETLGNQDIKFAFDYLFKELKIPKLDCITHSGGGISLTINLINFPQYQAKINSITMFACQAFGAVNSTQNFLKVYFANLFTKMYGSIPASKIGRGEDESYYFMKQWFGWNLEKNFIGESGINYEELMDTIKVPIFGISGTGDKFIAPKDACETYISSFKNKENKYRFFGTENGFSEDYNHGRIIHSRNARKEIYPEVLNWIIQTVKLSR